MNIDSSIPVVPATGALHGLARQLFGDDGFGFRDILDLVNPLQHIPIVGNVYREMTGDTIAAGMRVAGGALFGGPLGAAFSLAGIAVERGRAAVDEAGTRPPQPVEAPARGGWLLAAVSSPAAREEPAAGTLAAVPAPRAVPRGGWLLGAAYSASAPSAAASLVDTRA